MTLKQTAIRETIVHPLITPMTRKMLALITAVLLLVVILVTGILWFELTVNNRYTYPISVGQKTYIITVLTNWNSAPKVDLSESNLKFVSIDFVGSFRELVSFK